MTVADRVHARSARFRGLLDRTLALVEETLAAHGPALVMFSGGKDSTVLLDLVRRTVDDAFPVLLDSGLEHPGTYALAAHYGVEVIPPARPLAEMLRAGGYWGYRGGDEDLDWYFDHITEFYERPTARLVAERGVEVTALGLRAEESAARRLSLRRRTSTYWHQRSQTWRLCPLAAWSYDDVWAYLADRGLAYNEVYDRMAEHGVPRVQQRVSCLIDLGGTHMGRYAWFRQVFPSTYNQLCSIFPMIGRYT